MIDAKEYANKVAISGYKDRTGEQVSVHSSHRHHTKIVADVTHVLASVDRHEIDGRKLVESEGMSSNHFRLK